MEGVLPFSIAAMSFFVATAGLLAIGLNVKVWSTDFFGVFTNYEEKWAGKDLVVTVLVPDLNTCRGASTTAIALRITR